VMYRILCQAKKKWGTFLQIIENPQEEVPHAAGSDREHRAGV